MTKFNNSAVNGYVDADGFKGAASAADIAANRGSTQPALFPNGVLLPGGITNVAQIVDAAGTNQQAVATAVTPGIVIVKTVAATTRAIRLSVPTTNSRYEVYNDTATALKVYPATNATISSTATNGAVQILAHKGEIFYMRNNTHAVVIGAGGV